MNRNELRVEMLRHGDTSETLAAYLRISMASFSKKINAQRDFRQREIQKIKDRYQLAPERLDAIFFAPEVTENAT